MAFDGVVLASVTKQLQETILGGRIDKVYQPSERDIILHIRGRGQNYRLLLSAHASFPRAHFLTLPTGPNPDVPPMFCMLLRKHAEGSRITDVRQVDMERILWIEFEHRDELGDMRRRRLIVEIMGRHSNLILVDPDSDVIMDSAVHLNRFVNRYREVLPGRQYVAPPDQRKMSPLTRDIEQFIQLRSVDPETPLSQWLVQHVSGISPTLAREVAYRAAADDIEVDALTEGRTLFDLVEAAVTGRETPCVVTGADETPLAFSAVRLLHLERDELKASVQPYSDISVCIEHFYSERFRGDVIKQKSGDLIKFVGKELERLRSKRTHLEDDLAQTEQIDEWRLWGELLNTFGAQIAPGSSSASLPNYYEEDMKEITIPLDPARSASENAKAYFKRYTKVRTGVPIIQEQLQQTDADILYLETIATHLEQASLSDVDDIREELETGGFLRKSRKHSQGKRPSRKQAVSQPARYLASDGTELFVGKNNQQNDLLTMKFAQKTDTWLHAKDIPGSHVIVRARDVSQQTLQEAALLAAWFSKARESSQVPVDYTLVRNVWKPNGARPGFVLYEHQKTLYITPDQKAVEALEKKQTV